MNKLLFSILAFTGGTALAAQSGLNSQLGTALKNPLLASVIAFFQVQSLQLFLFS